MSCYARLCEPAIDELDSLQSMMRLLSTLHFVVEESVCLVTYESYIDAIHTECSSAAAAHMHAAIQANEIVRK